MGEKRFGMPRDGVFLSEATVQCNQTIPRASFHAREISHTKYESLVPAGAQAASEKQDTRESTE